MTTATLAPETHQSSGLTSGRLPRWGSPALLAGTAVVAAAMTVGAFGASAS